MDMNALDLKADELSKPYLTEGYEMVFRYFDRSGNELYVLLHHAELGTQRMIQISQWSYTVSKVIMPEFVESFHQIP